MQARAPRPFRPGRAAPSEGVVSPEVWEALDQRRFFFGHQSVGDDILAGLVDLAEAAGRPAPLRLTVTSTAEAAVLRATDGVLVDAHIGRNGASAVKIAQFRDYLRAGIGEQIDVALMKFCYADVDRRTDANRLLKQYVTAMALLEGEFPRVTLLHATIPLTTTGGVADLVRTHYNSALRGEVSPDRVVDIAANEALTGERPALRRGRHTYESMAAALSSDGGHLNANGRARLAACVLAAVTSVAVEHRA